MFYDVFYHANKNERYSKIKNKSYVTCYKIKYRGCD